MPAGRPTSYTKELGDFICEKVATHTVGLSVLCEMFDEFPVESTVRLWRYKHEEFSANYARAKQVQAELMAEEIIEISDDTSRDTVIGKNGEMPNSEWISRSRLRVDSRKWIAGKLAPKIYGDRYVAELKLDENESLKEEIRILRAKLDEQNRREY